MNEPLIIQEVLRYIGVPKAQAEETLKNEVEELYTLLKEKSMPKWTKQLNHIQIEEDTITFIESGLRIASRDLSRVLKNCKSCVILAVTLGASTDMLIRQRQSISMSQALIVDACASAYIEEICDQVELEVMDILNEGEYMTMRYSPGYGDVSLEVQPDLLQLLQAPKRMGLNVSRSGMLIPTKSVTAFIGISNKKENRQKTCKSCMLQKTCMYKRRGEHCGN